MKLFTTSSYNKSHNTLHISEINSWWIMSWNISVILSSAMVKWILSSGGSSYESKTVLILYVFLLKVFSILF